MKKLVLVFVVGILLLGIPATLFAQDVDWEGNFEKGDFSVFAGIGFGGYGFSIVPGVEYTFAEWKAGDVVPLSFGITGKGSINIYSDYWTAYGGGALVTVHLGFRGLDIPEFLQRFDAVAEEEVSADVAEFEKLGIPLRDVEAEVLAVSSRFYLAFRELIKEEKRG